MCSSFKKKKKNRERDALLWRICISFGRFASRRGTEAVCCSFVSKRANALQCLKKKIPENVAPCLRGSLSLLGSRLKEELDRSGSSRGELNFVPGTPGISEN